MRGSSRRALTASILVAIVGLAVLAAHHIRGSSAHGSHSGAARGVLLKAAALPEQCALRMSVSLPEVLSQPSFARRSSAQMVIASALSRTPEAHDIVDRLVAATESHSLEDLIAIHACRERLDGGFVASVQGNFRKGALSSLLKDGAGKWTRVEIHGVEAFVSTSRRWPVYAQAEDGSFLVAGSEASFARAVDRAVAGAAPPSLPKDSGLRASISFDQGPDTPVKGSAVAWEHARQLDVSANFQQRSFNAELEVDKPESAAPVAQQLRVLAAAALAHAGGAPAGPPSALAYLVQRARISTHSNVVVIDSELSGDALEWLSAELSNRARSRANPT